MIVPHRAAKMRRGAFFASGAHFHKGHTSNNLLFVGKSTCKTRQNP